jgi:AcrR family transcriptional regulator
MFEQTIREKPITASPDAVQAIQAAFRALLAERSYDSITIGDIAERARVGRSTFYRYYPSKPDLFVAMQTEAYEQLGAALCEREAWLSDTPPAAITTMLHESQRFDSNAPFIAMLGRDADYLVRKLEITLHRQFQLCLSAAFPEQSDTALIDMLAYSLTAHYLTMLRWWATERLALSEHLVAAFIHRSARAMVLGTLGLER